VKETIMRPAFLLVLLAGCAADGVPFAPEVLPTELHLDTAGEGVHPDRSVLDDPGNPFTVGALAQDLVWDLQSSGGPVAGFYAWATINARGPSGARQYYAALDLKAVVELELAAPDHLPVVRARAIRGFQSMLDHFPDAVTYDVTGTIAWELATPAVKAIIALGGVPQGGWVLVSGADGSVIAVRR
jgi:hypothetical protein